LDITYSIGTSIVLHSVDLKQRMYLAYAAAVYNYLY
jgi:hypothetical protein